jgi:excisionase family DNA binding protein
VSDERLTISVEDAARLLGISRGLAYEAARHGELPVIRLGRRLLVPRARLLELVGADPSFGNGAIPDREEVSPATAPAAGNDEAEVRASASSHASTQKGDSHGD